MVTLQNRWNLIPSRTIHPKNLNTQYIDERVIEFGRN